MSRKTKVEAERTRARILANALALFVKKGYDHTTFNDIAARLKMTKGAVYWHFASKESLLVALVTEMMAKFQRRLDELLPKEGLSFPVVAEAMVAHAERTVSDPKGAAFFLLIQTQVKWSADSMEQVRQKLLSRDADGPYHAFIRALEADKAAGRIRADVNPVALASVSVSVWSGLVRSKIEKFLECDLSETLRKTYAAIWQSVKS